VSWKSAFEQNITGIPATYDPETFKTHRSGNSTFTYTIKDFLPGSQADITLGFAENYVPNCYTGKRMFNVIVNGIFWETVDVHGSVGCNAAMTMSKTFAADSIGYFVIEFQSVKNNPMVSTISIVSLSLPSLTDAPTFSAAPSVSAMPSPSPPVGGSGAGPIEKLVLVNASDRSDIGTMQSNYVINPARLGTAGLSIRADLSYPVDRVRFTWGDEGIRNEGKAPYVMGGKAGAFAFNAVPYLLEPGSDKEVVVTAFDAADTVLGTYTLGFSVLGWN